MAQKRKRQSPELSSTRDGFSFIAPIPLELCHARLLSLNRLSWVRLYPPTVGVIVSNVGQERFAFEITTSRARGIFAIALLGEITSQTEETTLVSGRVQDTFHNWCIMIPFYTVFLFMNVGLLVSTTEDTPLGQAFCMLAFMWIWVLLMLLTRRTEKHRLMQQLQDTLSAQPTFDELGIQPTDGDVY